MDSKIEEMFWETYLKWKAGDITICDRLGYESTMKLDHHYKIYITTKKFFIVDFVELSTRIAIELDGFKYHHATKQQVISDKQRERKLCMEDYTILRYSGTEIYKDCIEVLSEIYHTYCIKAIKQTNPKLFKQILERRSSGKA